MKANTLTIPQFGPGDMVGFHRLGKKFVVGRIQYIEFIGGQWNYSLDGFVNSFQESYLIPVNNLSELEGIEL